VLALKYGCSPAYVCPLFICPLNPPKGDFEEPLPGVGASPKSPFGGSGALYLGDSGALWPDEFSDFLPVRLGD